jgi:hypothetical protein
MAAGCVLAVAGFYTWMHRWQVAESVSIPQGPVAPVYTSSSEAEQAKGMATITGPLAAYMSDRKGAPTQMPQPSGSGSRCATPSCKPTEMDMVVRDSPVGTSTPILHKTFDVGALVKLPFEIPPHSANPQLRGSYRSFLPKGRMPGDETSADVEFLLLNQQQYDTFFSGHESGVIFSAPDSHNQEVNAGLPPTFAQPARYYLVFRNNSPANGKKLVQADFRVDF